MTTYSSGDVLLFDLPFTDLSSSKPRPVLVLLDAGDDDILLARVTSQSQRTAFDCPLVHWRSAGLLLPSVVRLDKLVTLAKTRMRKLLGTLHTEDHASISLLLRKVFSEWVVK